MAPFDCQVKTVTEQRRMVIEDQQEFIYLYEKFQNNQ